MKIWKRTVVILSAIALFGIILALCYGIHARRASVDQLPPAAAAVLEDYLKAYQRGTPYSVKYMHFENDAEISAYINCGSVLYDYRLKSVEEVNPSLYALTLEMSSSQSVLLGQTWETVYSFLGLIDGRWNYIGNIRHIPDDLKTNLDPSRYQYDDPNILDPDNLPFEGSEVA